jgi:ABC-2 type transport system permease protein
MSANINIDSNTEMRNAPAPQASVATADLVARVRPFYWSLRRELWENRSIYIAPAAVALLVLFSVLVGLLRVPQDAVPFQRLLEVPPSALRLAGLSLYGAISGVLGVTAGIVGWFYCLDALSGERRDRSILFWRSLPVSDTTTVLSKVLIGMIVVPLVALIVGIALFIVLLLISSIVLAANDVSGTLLIKNGAFGEALVVHIYAATCAILWCAPLYAWAIFVSSWARRATFLWALMPPAAIMLFEGLAFGTQKFMAIVSTRLSGGLRYAFVEDMQTFNGDEFRLEADQLPESILSLVDPARFFSQPSLWIGLAIATAFIAASIWMRRYREPL